MKKSFFYDIKRNSFNVPRYTSYPTAPHFTEKISSDLYKNWLTQIPKKSSISLYIHIPFCKKLCWFCGCNMRVTNHQGNVSEHVDFLIKEIELLLQYLDKSLIVKHIHFGGGSPTILEPESFLRLVETLQTNFIFDKNINIDIELDPRNILKEKVASYAKAGVKRASFGIQCFDPKVQESINRIQPVELVKNAFNILRSYGINNINSDLIYGLPYQNTSKLLKTIDIISELNSSRIALFGYAHVPWMKKHQKLITEESLPKIEERIEMVEKSQEHLKLRGYLPVGLDHFAKKDDKLVISMDSKTLNRNFQGYSTDNEDILISIGNSSIGMLHNGYVQNDTSIESYQESISKGNLATKRGIQFTKEDIIRKEIIFSLMCYLSVDLNQIIKKYSLDKDHFNKELILLEDFIKEKAIVIDNNVIIIKEEARMAIRVIASKFDTYLRSNKAKHSIAV